ncbi:hypothetical protein O1L68_30540 [Streptomyces lydicus]|nr:hypothetical protein [Streptomyces lydicus]
MLLFDALPGRATALAMRTAAAGGRRTALCWGLDRAQLPRVACLHLGIVAVRESAWSRRTGRRGGGRPVVPAGVARAARPGAARVGTAGVRGPVRRGRFPSGRSPVRFVSGELTVICAQ